ncbi:sigma-70 family RNA polymerase sigma factor [Stieleria sp. JC731]|uniref:RNA polymerase sigma factor n=1 Tax=Pirellulaceae TaxID=2691357 RepID=UPI001E31801C|nr:sigma-70 family RNA polymerase sigma factor [Stieleria sp. JC731]MCC9600169.1 sigma-70 family RNA polymerase sigma factor [Stieleria sp. JC731]
MTSTDRSLVVAVRDGNEHAASILYDRYARRVFGLVRSKLGTKLGVVTEPEDIVQSVFKSVFRGMQSGNYDAPPGATLWNLLAVVAVRKLTNQANHHTRQRRDVSRNVSLDSSSDGLKESIDQASIEFLEICIRESLELLRPIDQEILTLRISGHSIEEIHQKTGRSRRTVERSLQRSREVLAELLLAE